MMHLLIYGTDPQSCRDREDRRCPPSIHEAASRQEAQVPAAPQDQQEGWQEDLRPSPTFHFLLSVFLFTEWSGWIGNIWISLGYACFTRSSTLGMNENP
jgi:hypothetical protein